MSVSNENHDRLLQWLLRKWPSSPDITEVWLYALSLFFQQSTSLSHWISLCYVQSFLKCCSNYNHMYLRLYFRVVEDANRWLKQHPGLVVRNCESVEIKVSTMDEYLRATTTKSSVYKSKFRPTIYIKGLRVWYSSMIINKLPCSFATTPCTLAYINIRPSPVSIMDQSEYEKFSSLVEKCNNLSRCAVFSGRILTVETVCVKVKWGQKYS